MTEPTIVVTDDHSDIGRMGHHPMAVLVKDGFGHTAGGMTGHSRGGVLFLDLFFPTDAMRRSGLAGRMLAAAEEEGRRRGCKSAVLSTIGIDGIPLDFFKERGGRAFGEIPRGPPNPPGTSQFFMTKGLWSFAGRRGHGGGCF